jgi:hypothetical protein
MNWRGRPLTSHEVVVATIASTRTRTGLAVAAELDTGRRESSEGLARQLVPSTRACRVLGASSGDRVVLVAVKIVPEEVAGLELRAPARAARAVPPSTRRSSPR